MFAFACDGSRIECAAEDLPDACRQALRLRAPLLDDGAPVDCLAVLGLDRPGLFSVPRPEGLRPTAEEVRALATLAGLSGAQVARLVGSTPRKFRAWAGGEDGMPWAAWHVLAVYVGLAEPARFPPSASLFNCAN
jgi:hypothetical protein